MEWSPVGHWSQWPGVTSPPRLASCQLLPEDEKNWRANCFCSNRLDTGRQEAVDFSLPSNPLLLLFPPNDTICGIINKQGVKFHERRNSSQSVNNSDFDLRQALLINVSLVPTLFWWLWYKFRLNILHMLFLNVLRLSHITHMYHPDLIWSSTLHSLSLARGQWSLAPGSGPGVGAMTQHQPSEGHPSPLSTQTQFTVWKSRPDTL